MTMSKLHKKNNRALNNLELRHEKEVMKIYLNSLREIRKKIQTLNHKGVFTKHEMFKYNRLNNLEKEIAQILLDMSKKNKYILNKHLKKLYRESYLRTGFELEHMVGDNLKYGLLKRELIDEAIKNPYDRIGWPTRSHENIKLLNRQVRDSLANGLIQGVGYEKIARDIKHRLGVGTNKALLISRTEGHRVRLTARQKGMEQAVSKGVILQKRWSSTLDLKTRDRHQGMDGETIDVDGTFSNGLKQPGDPAGSAADVINCRCDIVSIIKGYEPKVRRAKSGDKSEIIKYQNYEQWYKEIQRRS